MGAIKFLLIMSVMFPADFSDVTESISQGDMVLLAISFYILMITSLNGFIQQQCLWGASTRTRGSI